MPANTRIWARREINAASNNIHSSQTHLLKVINLYIDDHPEIAGPLQLGVENLDEIIDLIKRVRGMF